MPLKLIKDGIMSLLLWCSMAWAAEPAWTLQDTDLLRWKPGEDMPQVTLEELPEATPVEVILRDGDWVRVLVTDSLGWVASSSLGDEAPAETPAPAEPEGPTPPAE